MRAAIYARVSTADQCCEMQLSELRQYAAARGWDIAGEFVDEGFSGKNGKRPALKRCLEDARKRKFDAILAWKLDRWGRTVHQLVNDIKDLDSMGVRFISLRDNIDTDQSNPTSRLMLHIMGAFAEFERAVIVDRVQAGVRNAQKNGTRSGKAIGRPVKVFDRQKVRDLRNGGASLRDIALATGQPVTSVRRALG